MNKLHKYSKQDGVALIGVLIIVVLITSAYTFLLRKQSAFFISTKLNIEQSRIFNYFYSTQDLATDKLLERLTKNDKQYISRIKEDGEIDTWAFELSFATDEINFVGKLIDRSSKINLNQAFAISDNSAKIDTSKNYSSCLVNLSNQLGVEDVIPYIVDYVNQQDEKHYFSNINEIKNIQGISIKTYQKLKNFLYADFDRSFKININTASKEVLKCLHNDIDNVAAKNIIDNRPFTNIVALKNILYSNIASLENKDIDEQILPMLDINSNSFEMQSKIISGDSNFDIKSILIYSGGKIRSSYRTFNINL